MNTKKLDTQRRQVLNRITTAQVELAIAVEELLSITPEDTTYPASNPTSFQKRPVVDRATFSIRWRGHSCYLGWNVTFRLFERLARRPDCYVSYGELLQDAWQGAALSDEGVRSEVRRLRSKLCDAGMRPLAVAIRGHRHHYALSLKGLS